jgi:phospholipid/cholesterol/gamma-HCH transport system permease protein
METIQKPSEISFSRPTEDTLLVRLAGSWKLGQALPSADEGQQQVDSGLPVQRISFDTRDLTGWDSGLLTFLGPVIVYAVLTPLLNSREVKAWEKYPIISPS